MKKRERNPYRNRAKNRLEDYLRRAFKAAAEGPGNKRLKAFLRDPNAEAVIAEAGQMFEMHPGKTIIITSGPHPTRADVIRYALALERTKLHADWTEVIRLMPPGTSQAPGLGRMVVLHEETCPFGREPGVHENPCVCKPERLMESHETEPS